jgi:hypothetical protein
MSRINSNDTIGNRTRYVPVCSVVPQRHRAPLFTLVHLTNDRSGSSRCAEILCKFHPLPFSPTLVSFLTFIYSTLSSDIPALSVRFNLTILAFYIFPLFVPGLSAGLTKRGALLRSLWRAPKSYCTEQKED